MRQILDAPALIAPALPLPRSRAVDQAKAARRTTEKRASLTRIWGEAVQTLMAHPAPILCVATLSVTAPILLGVLVQRLINVEIYRSAGMIYVQDYDRPAPLAWLIQIVLAVLGAAFGRGVITRIALHGEGFRPACQATLARLPSLVIGSSLFAALTVGGAICAQVLLGVIGLDVQRTGTRSITLDGATDIAAKHSLDLLAVDASLPGDWVDHLRSQTAFVRHVTVQRSPDHYTEFEMTIQPNDAAFGRGLAGAVVLLLAAHVLLRFRAAAAFERGGANPLVALGRGIYTAARQPGAVAVHGLLLRAALCAACGLFVLWPIQFSRAFAVSFLVQRMDVPDLRVTLEFVMTAGMALACPFGWAFEAIYDARLYAAIRPQAAAEAWGRA
jgi:hypothetical protein